MQRIKSKAEAMEIVTRIVRDASAGETIHADGMELRIQEDGRISVSGSKANTTRDRAELLVTPAELVEFVVFPERKRINGALSWIQRQLEMSVEAREAAQEQADVDDVEGDAQGEEADDVELAQEVEEAHEMALAENTARDMERNFQAGWEDEHDEEMEHAREDIAREEAEITQQREAEAAERRQAASEPQVPSAPKTPKAPSPRTATLHRMNTLDRRMREQGKGDQYKDIKVVEQTMVELADSPDPNAPGEMDFADWFRATGSQGRRKFAKKFSA